MPKHTLGIILTVVAFLLLLPWINHPFTGQFFGGGLDQIFLKRR